MLDPYELARLPAWHPLRNGNAHGRERNYALAYLNDRQLTRQHLVDVLDRRDPEQHVVRRTDRVGPAFVYLMACGHRSVPGHAICERGCLTAPTFPAPVRRYNADHPAVPDLDFKTWRQR